MAFYRAAGILLHPTSLPSHGGIGDLGPEAYAFIDFLANSGLSLWQVLPLSPVGLGNSPYSATSAFAGNPLLISLEGLAEYGWVDSAEVEQVPGGKSRVDFELVNQTKLPLLRKAAQSFLRRPPDEHGEHRRFEAFCASNSSWLEDFVLFSCLREKFNGASWNTWPREIAAREPAALERLRGEYANELQIERALQFAFFDQWKRLHEYCRKRSISIVGDVAIFVNYDSADVWTNRDLFYLDGNLEPTVVSGVPPDAFSDTGQRWGNPLYNWEVLKQRGYDWWIRRMQWSLKVCDFVRLDHFRGFQQYWEIPASEPTAIRGRWVDGPKEDLFIALRNALGDLPFIAEDLGMITPDVHALRQRLGVPGMKVLQFGFGDEGAHIYLPHKYEPGCVAYTGTHDNDTTIGWWKTLPEDQRQIVKAYLGEAKDGVCWALMRTAFASVANFVIVPMQDVLQLDGSARMNTPSAGDGNWGWRFHRNDPCAEIEQKLADLVSVTDRAPKKNKTA